MRYFEQECHAAIEDGRVKTFTYLSAGQESIAAAVAESFKDERVNVFCQHRSHASYIAFGGDVKKLRDELLGLPSGTTGGMGGDPMHHFKNDKVWMVGHSGLVADQVPIGVGMALDTGQPSIILGGDATPEEDCFWPAFGFAVTRKLPVLFVIEDNGLSVLTKVEERRSWRADLVAKAHGLWNNAIRLPDNPIQIWTWLQNQCELPAYLEVDTNRMYRHVGAGIDNAIPQDRMKEMKERLLNQTEEIRRETWGIEAAAVREMRDLWNN